MARYTGTSGNDEVNGGSGNDRVDGLGGNDVARGGGGRDTVTGGAGDDRVEDGTGPEVDALFGNDGNDVLRADGGDDWLDGGTGNDDVDGGHGPDRMRGREGNDLLRADDGDEALAGTGDDRIEFRPVDAYEGEMDEGGEENPTNVTDTLLAGGKGVDAVYLDVTGATIEGGPPAMVSVFSYDVAGKFGVSIEAPEWGDHIVANIETTEALEMNPDGPPVRYTGNAGGTTTSSVSLKATNGADRFASGTDTETVDLLGGDDTAYLGRGGDVVALGGGADAVVLNGGYLGFVSATVTDFNGAEDRLEIAGFGPGALAITQEEGVGTRLEADGICDVLLAGVFDQAGFDFV